MSPGLKHLGPLIHRRNPVRETFLNCTHGPFAYTLPDPRNQNARYGASRRIASAPLPRRHKCCLHLVPAVRGIY